MAKLASARPAAAAPDLGAWLALRAWPAARAAAVPASILLLALFLRVIRLELQAWTPDTYEQMTAAHRLVSGEFPISTFYPPGVALTLAPAFVLFPQTLATQQAVVIGSSLALIVAAYYGTKAATHDRYAPTLVAVTIATAPQFLYFSRDGFFDVINAAWIVSAVLVVPWMRGRSLTAFAAYGLLLAVAISVRATNPAFLPALVIYWVGTGPGGVSVRTVWRAVTSLPLMVAAGAMVVAFLAFGSMGLGLTHATARAPLGFAHVGNNSAFYAASEFGGLIAAPIIAPLAALGAIHLWRRNRALLWVCLYMLTVFPLAHVPLPFANVRYMLPSLVFALILAAHAPASVISMTASQPAIARNTWRGILCGAAVLLAAYFALADGVMLVNWPAGAARSDEAAYRQLRPVIAGLPAGSLVVGGGTRGVRDSNARNDYLDLIDYSLGTDNGPQRVEEVMARLQTELDGGRQVYYLYTSVEGINITFATDGPGYQPYFDAASTRFRAVDVVDTDLEYFKLYKLELRR